MVTAMSKPPFSIISIIFNLNKPGLPSVKYSLLQYSKIKIFSKNKWTDWRAKVSQCRKTERGDTLRFLNIHSVAKHEKIEENKNFYCRKKISQCRKKIESPLGFSNIHSVAKQQKKLKGGPFWGKKFSGKSLAVPKKIGKGTLWSPRVWYGTRENRKNLFGSVR